MHHPLLHRQAGWQEEGKPHAQGLPRVPEAQRKHGSDEAASSTPGFGNAPAPGEIAHGAPPPPPVGGPNQPVAPAQNNAGHGYPPPKGALMIQKGRPTNRVQKKITRQINLAVETPPAIPEYLSGSESCITFSRSDHPC